ncbi:hypothetical protein Bbelb_317360 [Branchiostoma belcheri]|nr:hypothetical protein Bbelb_317360 [Branchiostoma belcheri]
MKIQKVGPPRVTDTIKRIRMAFLSLSSTGQQDALEFVDLLVDRLRFEIQSHTGYIEREITSTGDLLVLSLARFDHTTRTKDHRAVQLEENLITEQLRYQLKGIMCHHGYDFRSGHYTAWVNHHGQWFECSDETVVQHDIHDNPELARSSAIDVIEVNAAQEFVLTPAQDREKGEKKSIHQVFHNINSNSPQTKILITTPESLLGKERIWRAAIGLKERNLLEMVVVDEAHCMDEMGHEFRPTYLELSKVTELYTQIFGVTATPSTKDFITEHLNMGDCTVFSSSVERKNIEYSVKQYTLYKDTPRLLSSFPKHWGGGQGKEMVRYTGGSGGIIWTRPGDRLNSAVDSRVENPDTPSSGQRGGARRDLRTM